MEDVTVENNQKQSGVPEMTTDYRIREMTGMFIRLMEEFEVLRFGVFGMIGANLVLILILIFR